MCRRSCFERAKFEFKKIVVRFMDVFLEWKIWKSGDWRQEIGPLKCNYGKLKTAGVSSLTIGQMGSKNKTMENKIE